MLKCQIYSSLPEHLDGPLLVPDGQHLLHRVEGHGRGFVRVAVDQCPLETQVWRMDLLHDLRLEFVRNAWTQKGDQIKTHSQQLSWELNTYFVNTEQNSN